MIPSRIIYNCLICLFISACNTQEQTILVKSSGVKNTAPDRAITQQPVTVKNRPAINLSIDNMHIDHHVSGDNFLNTGNNTAEKNNILFETLSRNPVEQKIHLSGKLLTDEDKLENKEYLESVEGVQINIEGNFN